MLCWDKNQKKFATAYSTVCENAHVIYISSYLNPAHWTLSVLALKWGVWGMYALVLVQQVEVWLYQLLMGY